MSRASCRTGSGSCTPTSAGLDPGVTADIRQRQLGYLSPSAPADATAVAARTFRTRLIGDLIGMASPLL